MSDEETGTGIDAVNRYLGIEVAEVTDTRSLEEQKRAMAESCAAYQAANEMWLRRYRAMQDAEIVAAADKALPPDLDDLPVSSHFGGPPSIRDKARADQTVTEATFGGPRNYTQETAEWPGGKQ